MSHSTIFTRVWSYGWFERILTLYIYAIMFASTLCLAIALGIARTQDWVVWLDFNVVGEGMLEYVLMAGFFVCLTIKGCYVIRRMAIESRR